MKSPMPKLVIALMVAVFLSACATNYQPVPSVTTAGIDARGHALKTQNAVFILDASSSMNEGVQQWKKFDVATSVLGSMGNAIPEGMGIKAGLRSFGHDASVSSATTQMGGAMGTFSRSAHKAALAKIAKPGGSSPLGDAIAGAGGDLDGLGGNSALIVVSDGKVNDSAIVAAKALKAKMGSALCIYTIVVGDDPAGIKFMQDLAAVGGCGFATSYDKVSSGAQMADFVTKVFIGDSLDSDGDGVVDAKDKCPGTPAGVKVDATGCPLDSDRDGVPDYMDKCPGTPYGVKVDAAGCPLDSDGDGVPDYMDKCPGTPAGVKVDATGCPVTVFDPNAQSWTFNNINFEVNKAVLTNDSHRILNEIIAGLKDRPALKVMVEGHTDSTGAHAYNMDLSERRAKAVVDYLVGRGISPARLDSKGYGPDRPIADNGTKAGRAKNRRVQFTKMN